MAWSDKGGERALAVATSKRIRRGTSGAPTLFFRRSLPLRSPRIQPRGFPRPRPGHHTLGGVLVLANNRVIGNPTNGACVSLVGAELKEAGDVGAAHAQSRRHSQPDRL